MLQDAKFKYLVRYMYQLFSFRCLSGFLNGSVSSGGRFHLLPTSATIDCQKTVLFRYVVLLIVFVRMPNNNSITTFIIQTAK
jgi:hypothetical protein